MFNYLLGDTCSSANGVGPWLPVGLAGQPFRGSGSTPEPALPQEDRRVAFRGAPLRPPCRLRQYECTHDSIKKLSYQGCALILLISLSLCQGKQVQLRSNHALNKEASSIIINGQRILCWVNDRAGRLLGSALTGQEWSIWVRFNLQRGCWI